MDHENSEKTRDIRPLGQLVSILDAQVGPQPCERPNNYHPGHPFLTWILRRNRALLPPVENALGPFWDQIRDQERVTQERVIVGGIALEVLGQACRLVNVSCSAEKHSFHGGVVLANEFDETKSVVTTLIPPVPPVPPEPKPRKQPKPRSLDDQFERHMTRLQQRQTLRRDLLNQGLCFCRKPVEDGYNQCKECRKYKIDYNKTHTNKGKSDG